MGMSNYLENKLVDHCFRGVSFTAPTALHVALFTATPSDSGGGTEVSGGDYARVSLSPSTTNWAATNGATTTTNPSSGTSGETSNNSVITFATPSASWGSITSIGIFDASSGGNLLWWGALDATKTVNNGDSAPSFAISSLTISVDN